MKKRFGLQGGIVLLFLLSLVPFSGSRAQTTTPIFINEIHYDNASTDEGEAIEIAGPAGTDLTGWAIVLYNGNGGAPYNTTLLTGLIPDQQNGYGTHVFEYPTNGIQNGSPDGLALVDPSDNVIQFLSYEGSFTASGGPADGMTSTDINVAEGSGTPIGYSLQLTGSGTVYEDFTWSSPSGNTFGVINTGQSFGTAPPPPPDFVPIYDIQFTTDPTGDSPYAGETVTTQGIVTAFFYASGNRYTFIQDGTGPWSGLLLYKPEAFVNVGDLLEVTGAVSEYYGLTQIAEGAATILSPGNPLPAAEVLPSGAVSQEQWESVLARVENVNVIDEDLGFGEWLVDDSSGGVRIDDLGYYSYTPSNGDLLEFIQGPLYYNFSNFKIEPRDDDDLSLSACGTAFTPIYELQGGESASPFDGLEIETEGVVTGDFQGSSELKGFFIQDPIGDGDQTTSDGIFVYAPGSVNVDVGDVVRVAGEVDEYYGLTEITNVDSVSICGLGSVSATITELPVAEVDDLEQLEGMLITFPQALTASDNYNQHRYGEVVLSANVRQFNPTDIFPPGTIAEDLNGNSIADINEPGRIILDDGSTGGFPPTVPYIGADNTLRLGDTVTGLTGVLSYDFDFYRLHPTEPVTFARTNPRSGAPADVGGVIKVASFNTLNYWTTIHEGSNDARGADSLVEFERQREKLVAAILGLDADVVGLQELENNGATAIGDLVDALNATASSGTWAYVPDPDYPGGLESTNEIKVGIIYRADRVTPVGDPVADDDPVFAEDRPPIAQTFEAHDEIFTVVVNHLKSKGCDDATGLDLDQGDGQGCYNHRRMLQAEALLDFVATLQAASGDDDVVVLGDFNSYQMEDPIAVLQAGLIHPMSTMLADVDRYSYVYFGQTGLLDYIFTSESLNARVTGVDIWHINADEPRVLDYNDEVIDPAEYYGDFSHEYLYNPDAYRSSDHDPAILGFCDAVPPEVEISVEPDTHWPPNHKVVTVTTIVSISDNFDDNPVLELVSVTSNEPDDGLGDGDTAEDIVIVDDFTFELRAERSGSGDGRIYTITYRAADSCSNATLATVTVTVPADQGREKDKEQKK